MRWNPFRRSPAHLRDAQLPTNWRDRFADEHDNPADHATVRMADDVDADVDAEVAGA